MAERLFEIRHHHTNEVLFGGEYETLKLCVMDSQLSRTCRSDAMFSEHGVDPCS